MAPETVKLTILGITALVLIFDAYLYWDRHERNAISQVIIDWSKQQPFVAFVIGFLMGHWFG